MFVFLYKSVLILSAFFQILRVELRSIVTNHLYMRIISSFIDWVKTRSLLTKSIAVVCIVGLLWWGYRSFAPTTTTDTTPATSLVERSTLVRSLSSSGTVTSTNSRSVITSATGVVKKVFIQNDQTVQSGAALFELELDQESKQSYSQALASYQSAKNNLESAKTAYYTIQADMLGNWDTFKELSESDEYKDTNSDNRLLPEFIIPQNQWLASEAKYKQQEAVVAQAQTALNNASLALREASPTIYAPISGTVSGFSLQVGSVLAPTSGDTSTSTTKIANITTNATPTITINVTESDVTAITIGDKATIAADALADMTFTGSVISIDTVGSTSSGVTSYPVVLKLDSSSPNIFANMSVTASIITDTKDGVLLVPSSAIQTQNGVSTVQVLRDGVTESIVVETGLSSDTQTEITSGLNEGDLVVTSLATRATSATSTGTSSVFSGLGGFGGGTGGIRMSAPR